MCVRPQPRFLFKGCGFLLGRSILAEEYVARQRKKLKGSFEQTLAPMLFLTPNLLIFGIFIIIPAIMGLRMAFYEWSILGGHSFVGLKNFVALFQDEHFWKTFWNTIRYVAFVVPLLTISSLGLALLTVDNDPGVGFFRGIYYLPTMLSLIIVGISWRWILGDELGIVNYLIKISGGEPVRWLTTAFMANASLIFISVWAFTGFYMVMFIGGLQAIPEDLFDQAEIDGASSLQVFFKIKLPLIRPTMLVVIVLATIRAFKAFELIYVLTKGGPGSATKFLVQNIYQIAFEEDRMGYASAIAIMLLIVIGLFTMFQFRLNKEEYSNE
jgi:alpha-1,4-digalacturonate transport system permease protein